MARERDTRRWMLWAHALISPEGLDRRKASAALYQDFARDGDLVLVAGKGHEDYQVVGTTKFHLDDREEARAALAARGWKKEEVAARDG